MQRPWLAAERGLLAIFAATPLGFLAPAALGAQETLQGYAWRYCEARAAIHNAGLPVRDPYMTQAEYDRARQDHQRSLGDAYRSGLQEFARDQPVVFPQVELSYDPGQELATLVASDEVGCLMAFTDRGDVMQVEFDESLRHAGYNRNRSSAAGGKGRIYVGSERVTFPISRERARAVNLIRPRASNAAAPPGTEVRATARITVEGSPGTPSPVHRLRLTSVSLWLDGEILWESNDAPRFERGRMPAMNIVSPDGMDVLYDGGYDAQPRVTETVPTDRSATVSRRARMVDPLGFSQFDYTLPMNQGALDHYRSCFDWDELPSGLFEKATQAHAHPDAPLLNDKRGDPKVGMPKPKPQNGDQVTVIAESRECSLAVVEYQATAEDVAERLSSYSLSQRRRSWETCDTSRGWPGTEQGCRSLLRTFTPGSTHSFYWVFRKDYLSY